MKKYYVIFGQIEESKFPDGTPCKKVINNHHSMMLPKSQFKAMSAQFGLDYIVPELESNIRFSTSQCTSHETTTMV